MLTFKQRLIFLGGNAQAAFLDIAMGIVIVGGLAWYGDITLTIYAFMVAAWLAIFPDHDIIPTILRGRYVTFDHRQTILHRPIPVIAVLTTLAFLVAGSFWASVTLFCLLWHYLHDTDWTGKRYGVAWFWPFSKLYWSWFGRYSPAYDLPHEAFLVQYWYSPTITSVYSLIVSVGLVVVMSTVYTSLLLWLAAVMVVVSVVTWGLAKF